MIPPVFDLQIFQGDSFGGGWTVVLPDLTPLGGPADLTTAAVSAQIRAKQDPNSDLYATFDVEVLDAVARQVRPKLAPEQTASIPKKKGYWDLQVEYGGWVGTVLRGSVEVVPEVTR